MLLLIAVALGIFAASLVLKGYMEENSQRIHGSKANQPMTKALAYKVLAVLPSASEDEVKEAYRRLLQKLHPDQGGSPYLMDMVVQARNMLIKGE